MSPKDLPEAYLKKTRSRIKAIKVLMDDDNFSDVVCESQEVVELCSKGILCIALIDPPRRHDVAAELKLALPQLGQEYTQQIEQLMTANHWLRREREMAFYGADDFDRTEGYSIQDADRAYDYAKAAVELLGQLIQEKLAAQS